MPEQDRARERGPAADAASAGAEAAPAAGAAARVAEGAAAPEHRSGFVAIVGRPNVGKSTLLNRLVGQKIAITSPTPQTTRALLRGILTLPQAQIIFVDTPGLHTPRHRLGERMVEAARRALADTDAALLVIDAAEGVTEEDEVAARALLGARRPVVIGVNKVDRVKGRARVRVEADAAALVPAAVATIPLSALEGTNLPALVECLLTLMPPGPPLYPEDMVTDHPVQFLVREIIREKAIHLTRQEVPHAVAVEIEDFARREDKDGRYLTYIRATIHVERAGQKGILIGKEGRMLREVGRLSRQEIERLVGEKVYLDLWVKVTPGWREKDALVRGFYPQ